MGRFRCSGCGEFLSISYDWSERRWWAGVGLTIMAWIIFRPNPWLAGLFFIPVAFLIALALIAVSPWFGPPKLERSLPPGPPGTLGLRR
jgi:hypothetical protein